MIIEEKILLIQLILEDIRGNWNGCPEERARDARELCYDLVSYDKRFKYMIEDIERYIEKCKKYGESDGRYFRDKFPYGYEGMEKLHKLNKTYNDKSCKFQRLASKFLTYPEYRFDDWE